MTVKNEKGVNRIMKDRFAFALGFCRSGKLTYVHKTTKYVSERTVAVIIPKGKTYSLHCDESGEFPLINFQCVGFNPPSFTVIPLSDPAAYLSMFERIASCRVGEKNEFASLGAFYEILSMLSRESGNVKTTGAIQPAVDYLAVKFLLAGSYVCVSRAAVFHVRGVLSSAVQRPLRNFARKVYKIAPHRQSEKSSRVGSVQRNANRRKMRIFVRVLFLSGLQNRNGRNPVVVPQKNGRVELLIPA